MKFMLRISSQWLVCSVVMGVASACGAPEADEPEATASSGEALSMRHDCAPAVDPTIAVPEGNELAFILDATGVQIYTCQEANGAPAWVFQAPEAELFRGGRLVGSHYGGPTWEYRDGSTTLGTKLAAFTADPTSVPWLLLQATPGEKRGVMSRVTYIQRLDTVGGIAPLAERPKRTSRRRPRAVVKPCR